MPTPDHNATYTIQIPGVLDVLALPPLESPLLKQERAARMLRARSPIPYALQWIPYWINMIDDAQDVLITALLLGKLVLRTPPARMIPYAGTLLLASDVLNLLTNLLAAPLNPRTKKAHFHQNIKRNTLDRPGRVRLANLFWFHRRNVWLPLILQGGQVLHSFTGWGLRLGTIMAAISDTWWAVLRGLTIQRLHIQGPPPEDPLAKACRFLTQLVALNSTTELLNPIEAKILALATNAAMSIIGAPALPQLDDTRLDQLAVTPTPTFEPWSRSSRQALETLDFPPPETWRVPTPIDMPHPPFADAVRVNIAQTPSIAADLADRLRNPTFDFPYGAILTEAAQYGWDAFGQGFNIVVPATSPMEHMMGQAIERGLLPPFIANPPDPRFASPPPAAGKTIGPGVFFGTIRNGEYIYIQPWRFPAAYPPPSQNPHVQIAHWCAIGLALYCGRPILMPHYEADKDANARIVGWTVNKQRWKTLSMQQASLLVWGNIYRNWEFTFGEKEPGTTKKPSTCRPSPHGRWPALAETIPPSPFLDAVLAALPPVGQIPAAEQGHFFPEYYPGRDWLDSYIADLDPRRASGPPLIPIDPPPRVYDPLNP